MVGVGLPPPFGLDTTGKLFSKIYNVFSCSKKTQVSVQHTFSKVSECGKASVGRVSLSFTLRVWE